MIAGYGSQELALAFDLSCPILCSPQLLTDDLRCAYCGRKSVSFTPSRSAKEEHERIMLFLSLTDEEDGRAPAQRRSDEEFWRRKLAQLSRFV